MLVSVLNVMLQLLNHHDYFVSVWSILGLIKVGVNPEMLKNRKVP